MTIGLSSETQAMGNHGELAEEFSADLSGREGQQEPAPAKLPAVLGMSDLTLFMVLIVLFVSNTNGVQFGGPIAFLYWTLGLITFLVPCALVTQWLARRYPGPCAPYLWVTRILGPKWSFISAFCIWLPGVLAVVSVIDNGLIFIQYLAPTWFATPIEQCLGIVLILSIATSLTCLPLRWLKRFLGLLAVLYLGIFALVGITGLWWLESGHSPAVALNVPGAWQPTAGNFPIYGVIVLAFLGVNIPLFMSGEVRHNGSGSGGKAMKRVSRYVWWGTGLSFLAYVGGTFGIMVIVPASSAGNMTANVQVIQMIYGPVAGIVADIVLVMSQLAITIAYILMFARMLIIVAQDRRLPAFLARVNRHGVPVQSILVQAAIVAGVTILSFVAIPTLFGAITRPADLAVEIYNVTQAGTSVVWLFSIVQLFVLVLWFLYQRKHRVIASQRRRMLQRILLTTTAVMGISASLIGVWATVSSSWIPMLISNNHWTILVLCVISVAFMAGWFGSELPRMHALLGEERRVTSREIALRKELEASNKEQQLLVDQQQELLAEVDRLYREQAQAAVTDAITGLPNHRAVMSRLEEEVSHCSRANGTCAILFVDLDHFKRVNDTWGHLAGDFILREIGARLRATLRLEDFVGRYGGEEFAIMLTDADLINARQTAERLRNAIANAPCVWVADDTNGETQLLAPAPTLETGVELDRPTTSATQIPITVTGSIGVAVYMLHGTTREKLVESADRAMYQAKHSGRNCVCVADIDIDPTMPSSPDGPSLETRFTESHEDDWESNVITQHPTAGRDKSGSYDCEPDVGEQNTPGQALQALTAAASAHDRNTHDHAQRMIMLAEATAHILQQPEEELHLLHLGALLHDIGKIGIPDAILHKPGPLSNEEWVVMRRHPEIGRQILEQTGGVFQHLASIVVAHHERWDGHGYPKGLAAEAIPMTARILAVVDAYDAMTSRRSYREPLTSEEARAELKRCAGSQFDPHVVAVFLQVLDERQEGQETLPGALARA